MFLTAMLAVLVALALLTVARIPVAETLPDQLLAGDMTIALLTFILAIVGALQGSDLYLDAALVAALLAFTGTVTLARFLATGRVM